MGPNRRDPPVRLFVSVDLPVPGLGAGFGTPDAPTHLTLAFLGEVDEEKLPLLTSALGEAVRDASPFTVVARGVGAFPSTSRPRIVWVGVGEGRAEVDDLARRVRAALLETGVPFDTKPFVAHATVLRVRRPADQALAHVLLRRAPTERLGERRVDSVDLKASRLDAGGAVHRLVARLPLEGPESTPPPATP